MNKKVFTLLLLAVFLLAQFSVASAATIADVTVTIATQPTFSSPATILDLDYALANMPGGLTQNVLLWHKDQFVDWNAVDCIDLPGNVNTLTAANGTYAFDFGLYAYGDQDVVEFLITVVDAGSCGAVLNLPAADTASQASTFIDGHHVDGFIANPPSLSIDPFSAQDVSCNTFELWGLESDNAYHIDPGEGYSGFDAWNVSITGTFAPPAPVGLSSSLLEWEVTFPSTASGAWNFEVNPDDVVGNGYWLWNGTNFFRDDIGWGATVGDSEKEPCLDFTDALGANEVYIRYLADVGLISGFADGTFGPDNTLTRAEASALFEKANGWVDEVGLPATAPSAACTFTDVSASDWFSGWVWQACADGFMNGVGGGLFDPNNLLTRGQIVTVINNIYLNASGTPNSYLDDGTNLGTVLNEIWGFNWGGAHRIREAAWTDVAIGAFYATPIINAYEVGVAEGTTATTFSPDQPVSRGEFAKMLYRALSRVW